MGKSEAALFSIVEFWSWSWSWSWSWLFLLFVVVWSIFWLQCRESLMRCPINNVWAQIFSCILLLCVFSLRPMLADLPRKQAAKHSRHSGRSMHARLRTPSCHGGYQIQKLVLYSNLLTIYGMLCASSRGSYVQSCVESYVQSYICASSYDIVVLMCLFWFIWQASGAGSHSAFPHTMWLDDDEEICYGKQAKEDINFITQKMFSYGPYESHKYLQYYASCWFLWIF